MDSPTNERQALTQHDRLGYQKEPEYNDLAQAGSSKRVGVNKTHLSEALDNVSRGDNEAITPPPQSHPSSRHNSGLPPTPPTMTNSEVAAAQNESAPSPPPQVFADRVRNALESRKSGLTTPVGEGNTPPTPDKSPLGVNLQSRPALRNDCTSFTESFKTATEGFSGSGSTSRIHSPITELDRKHDWLNIPVATRASVARTGSDDTIQNQGSDAGEVRVKNYHVESDSDSYKNTSLRSNNTDESPTSPAVEMKGFYHRLRRPIEPGDDLKRVDNAMIYGTPSWKRTVPPQASLRTTDHRPSLAAAQGKPSSPPSQTESVETASVSPVLAMMSEQIQDTKLPAGTDSPRKESPPIKVLLPSTSVSDETLERNNRAYQMIQTENAKRWSIISEGSGIQAVVITSPQRSRTLRHTSKCESLRGDVSVASLGSKESSPLRPKVPHDSDHGRSKPYGDLIKNSIRAVSVPVTDERIRPAANTKLPMNRIIPQSERRSVSESQPRKLRRSNRDLGLDRVTSLRGDTTPRVLSADLTNAIDALPLTNATPRQLRRTSAEKRLDRDDSVRRTSLGSSFRIAEATPVHQLRRVSHEQRLSYNNDVRRTSLPISEKIAEACLAFEPATTPPVQSGEHKTAQSSETLRDSKPMYIGLFSTRSINDQDWPSTHEPERATRDIVSPRSMHPSATPISISQFSYVTDGEVCEAKGMEIFPHNNASLLMVQHGSHSLHGLGLTGNELAGEVHAPPPVFEAYVQRPAPPDGGLDEQDGVDIANAHAAVEPPKLVFIPPTPVEDLDREINDDSASPRVQRRRSFKEIVRRYSESLAQPLVLGRSGSFRRHSYSQYHRALPGTALEARPTYLSSLWQPRDFWEDYASSDEDDYDDWEDQARLPPGGDTSDVLERRSFFPRNMSVRMPGFRGNGGFLKGNSLGIERHGTNNRRHYVARRSGDDERQDSTEPKRRPTFTLPFTGGTKVEYVGLSAVSARFKWAKARRNNTRQNQSGCE